MELNERKLQILQAIVADFISSAEPVGSRTLSKKYGMNLSPATIRNEMSDLEEMGYLTHPHTSAGRIPSAKAYRLYVDKLMQERELPQAYKDQISQRLDKYTDELDTLMQRTAGVLSEMTKLISFAITPGAGDNNLKYVNLLPVDEHTVVLMIVTEDGKIHNTAVKLNCTYTEDNLQLMAKVLTANLKGRTVNDILTMDIIDTLRSDLRSMSELTKDVLPSFMQTLEKMLDVNLYMDGYSNVFSLPEYNDIAKARDFFSLVENKDQLTDVLVNRDHGLIITIGDENSEDMKDLSLITADYRIGGKLVGRLGVIGPTRMKYSEISSVIKYLTDNINRSFELEGPSEVSAGRDPAEDPPEDSGAVNETEKETDHD